MILLVFLGSFAFSLCFLCPRTHKGFKGFLASISQISRRTDGNIVDFKDGEGRCGRYCLLLEISCPAHTGPRVRIPYPPPTKNALLSTKTKVRFLNDVCLRQMMLASPMMTATPNDVWLCHILWQTSHHCETKWINIIFA